MYVRLALAIGLLAGSTSAYAQDTDQDGVNDSADVFPCDTRASAVAYAPAQDALGTVLFEDQWPEASDLDFNDVAVGYHYTYRTNAQGGVVGVRAVLDVLALGGTLHNGLGLRFPVAANTLASATLEAPGGTTTLSPSGADAELTFVVASNLRAFFGGAEGTINSDGSGTAPAARLIIEVDFTTPVALDGTSAPHDLYIFRTNDVGHEIHRPMYGGTASMNTSLFNSGEDNSSATRRFVDYDGLPYALDMPARVDYPREAVAIEQLYPRILPFAASGGATDSDYYTTVGDAGARYTSPSAGAVPPLATDNACLPVEPPGCRAILDSGNSQGDGIYTVDLDGTGPAAPVDVYCDMTTAGGGWMLAHHKASGIASAAYDLTVGQLMVRGLAMRTATSDPTGRPALPDGAVNTFDQVLFVGGNGTWQNQMGGWVRFDVSTVEPVSTQLQNVLTANGRTAAWLSNTGWGGTTTAANGGVVLWDTQGISPICGGANVGRGRHCPAAVQGAYGSYPYHFDTTGARTFYVR